MDTIFQRMQLPDNAEVCVIEPPEEYPTQHASPFTGVEGSEFDAVEVYVKSPDLFAEEVAEGERLRKKDGLLWVATPADQRDVFTQEFMRQQGKPLGLQPVESVNLDERWDANRFEVLG